MYKLLKIDFRKYFYSKSFWVLLSIYLFLNVVAFFTIELMLNNMVINAEQNSPMPVKIPTFSLYNFPLIWHNLAFLGGFFKIWLALIVVIHITGEFSARTTRMNIMNGLSRNQFLYSKVLFAILVSLLATITLLLSGSLLGLLNAEQVSLSLFLEKIQFIPAYFLELLTFNLIAMVVAFLLRQSGLAIGILALYYYLIEPILSYVLPDSIVPYLPVESMGNLIDIPNSSLMKMFGVNFSESVSIPDMITSLAYCALSILIVYLVVNRRDF
jgi:ABC-2 type transport system permease protein